MSTYPDNMNWAAYDREWNQPDQKPTHYQHVWDELRKAIECVLKKEGAPWEREASKDYTFMELVKESYEHFYDSEDSTRQFLED